MKYWLVINTTLTLMLCCESCICNNNDECCSVGQNEDPFGSLTTCSHIHTYVKASRIGVGLAGLGLAKLD